MPFATAHNVRLVALNRRDYPESSPYSPEELAALSSNDNATRGNALRATGLQFGAFLAWFIDTQGTPPMAEDANGKREGGIAFIAWSLGHTSAAPLIAYPDLLPENQRSLLKAHLRAYGTLGQCMSFPSPTLY